MNPSPSPELQDEGRGLQRPLGLSPWEILAGSVSGIGMQALFLWVLAWGTLDSAPEMPSSHPVEFLLLPAPPVARPEPGRPAPSSMPSESPRSLPRPASPESRPPIKKAEAPVFQAAVVSGPLIPAPPIPATREKPPRKRADALPMQKPRPRKAVLIPVPPVMATPPAPTESRKTAFAEQLLSRKMSMFSGTPRPSPSMGGRKPPAAGAKGNGATQGSSTGASNPPPLPASTGAGDPLAAYLRGVHDLLQKRISRDRGFRLTAGRATEECQAIFRITVDGRVVLEAVTGRLSGDNESHLRDLFAGLRFPAPPESWVPERPIRIPLFIRGR